MKRFNSIDAIRGFAVTIMIIANTTPYFIDIEDNNLIRFLFSLAAPIFLIITGYVSQLSLSNLDLNRTKFVSRIFQILFFGVLIDLLFWKSIPFMTTDILYLIAFSQFFLLITLNNKTQLFLILFIFLISFQSHYLFNYRFEIPDLSINANLKFNDIIINNPFKRFFFDGWFPVLPWMGFILLGAASFRFNSIINKFNSIFLISGFVLLFLSYLLIHDNFFPIRDHYLELWYPANGLALLIPFSMFLIVIGFISLNHIHNMFSFKFIISLGRNSLFAYVFNALLISIVIDFDLNKINDNNFLYLIMSIVITISFTILIDKFRNTLIWEKTPMIIKFLLGYH
jgi:uncharacterized membrane protein